jgi:hypothetical protein
LWTQRILDKNSNLLLLDIYRGFFDKFGDKNVKFTNMKMQILIYKKDDSTIPDIAFNQQVDIDWNNEKKKWKATCENYPEYVGFGETQINAGFDLMFQAVQLPKDELFLDESSMEEELQKIEYTTRFIAEAHRESLGLSVIELGDDYHRSVKKIKNLPSDTEVIKLVLRREFNKKVFVDWDITVFLKNGRPNLPDDLNLAILEFAKKEFPEHFRFYYD